MILAVPNLRKHTALAQDFIERVAEATFAEFSDWFKPNGCILATRVFIGVMQELGVHGVKDVSVTELLLNKPAANHCQEHGCIPTRCQEIREVLFATVGVLGGSPDHIEEDKGQPGRWVWGGHLAALVMGSWVADLTISQMSRPEKGLTIDGTLTYKVDPPWVAGETWCVQGSDDLTMFAHRNPDGDGWWRNDFDFSDNTSVRSLIAGTLARLRGEPTPLYPASMRLVRQAIGKP